MEETIKRWSKIDRVCQKYLWVQQYAINELESLALLYDFGRFRYFFYGKLKKSWTDQEVLESLIKNWTINFSSGGSKDC